jgi:hypothetical protein
MIWRALTRQKTPAPGQPGWPVLYAAAHSGEAQREDCAAAVAAIGGGDAATVEFGDQSRNKSAHRYQA